MGYLSDKNTHIRDKKLNSMKPIIFILSTNLIVNQVTTFQLLQLCINSLIHLIVIRLLTV